MINIINQLSKKFKIAIIGDKFNFLMIIKILFGSII